MPTINGLDPRSPRFNATKLAILGLAHNKNTSVNNFNGA